MGDFQRAGGRNASTEKHIYPPESRVTRVTSASLSFTRVIGAWLIVVRVTSLSAPTVTPMSTKFRGGGVETVPDGVIRPAKNLLMRLSTDPTGVIEPPSSL